MDPVAWGPPLWALLHTAATQQPQSDAPLRALRAMRSCLPCCHCRGSLRTLLPPVLSLPLASTADKLWALHNAINRKLDKPQLRLANARRRWGAMTSLDPLALLDALLITAYNFDSCATRRKLQAYRQLWTAVADMCAQLCLVSDLEGGLRAAARARTGHGIAHATNAARTAWLRRRKCARLVFTRAEAAAHYSLARGKPARGKKK